MVVVLMIIMGNTYITFQWQDEIRAKLAEWLFICIYLLKNSNLFFSSNSDFIQNYFCSQGFYKTVSWQRIIFKNLVLNCLFIPKSLFKLTNIHHKGTGQLAPFISWDLYFNCTPRFIFNLHGMHLQWKGLEINSPYLYVFV